MKQDKANVGEKIRSVRQKANLTQEELARKAGIATITLRQYENGKRQPKIEPLKKIASVFDMSVSDFIDGVTDSSEHLKREQSEVEFARKRWETGIMRQAIDEYGANAQLRQVLEECLELMLAIVKLERFQTHESWENVAEERADVGIMLDQLDIMLDTMELSQAIRTQKLVRLEQRLGGMKE